MLEININGRDDLLLFYQPRDGLFILMCFSISNNTEIL
jgi:hypothetical protein